jgi:hypothetical protein
MSDYEFSEFRIPVPKHDADVIIVLPGGKEIKVQLRPSNADVHEDDRGKPVPYNGSLDLILPDDDLVMVYEGDDMQPSDAPDADLPHARTAKQLVTELPGDYGEIKITRS